MYNLRFGCCFYQLPPGIDFAITWLPLGCKLFPLFIVIIVPFLFFLFFLFFLVVLFIFPLFLIVFDYYFLFLLFYSFFLRFILFYFKFVFDYFFIVIILIFASYEVLYLLVSVALLTDQSRLEVVQIVESSRPVVSHLQALVVGSPNPVDPFYYYP